VYGQHLPPGRGPVGGGGEDVPFSDAFDFSFDRYATPAVIPVVYGLVLVTCVLAYLGGVALAFGLFLPDMDLGFTKVSGTPWPGVLATLLGWIPPLIAVLSVRVGLEQTLATVRTALDARALRTRYVGHPYV
jgi:hypothetical protein